MVRDVIRRLEQEVKNVHNFDPNIVYGSYDNSSSVEYVHKGNGFKITKWRDAAIVCVPYFRFFGLYRAWKGMVLTVEEREIVNRAHDELVAGFDRNYVKPEETVALAKALEMSKEDYRLVEGKTTEQ